MPRLVVVTGGANGLGQGIVRRLAGDGYRVLFCDVDREGERPSRRSFPARVWRLTSWRPT